MYATYDDDNPKESKGSPPSRQLQWSFLANSASFAAGTRHQRDNTKALFNPTTKPSEGNVWRDENDNK